MTTPDQLPPARVARGAFAHAHAAEIEELWRTIRIDDAVIVIEERPDGRADLHCMRRPDALAIMTKQNPADPLAAALAASTNSPPWILVVAFGGSSGGPCDMFGIDLSSRLAPVRVAAPLN
ncbi:MAG: hypothetical protein ABJE95_32560 [Byssovorax sp.]